MHHWRHHSRQTTHSGFAGGDAWQAGYRQPQRTCQPIVGASVAYQTPVHERWQPTVRLDIVEIALELWDPAVPQPTSFQVLESNLGHLFDEPTGCWNVNCVRMVPQGSNQVLELQKHWLQACIFLVGHADVGQNSSPYSV